MQAKNFLRASVLSAVLTVLCVLSVVFPAFAGPLVNSGVYVSPTTVSAGQTVILRNSIKATAPVTNVTVILEVHRLTATGTINSYVFFSKVLTGQNFALNEEKVYQHNYVIPASNISGTYTYTIKATNAANTETYLDLQRNYSPYTFTVNARANESYVRGVNIMDLGIAGNALPGVYGTNYTKPSLSSLQNLKNRGLGVVRIPFLWERIQPTLGGNLDSAYLGYLLQVLRDANSLGLKVIVDMHNYGRYTPTNTSARVAYAFGDPNAPTQAQYADAWQKIVNAIKADATAYNAVYAYDIMNEPHDLKDRFLNSVPVSTFESGTEGWVSKWPSTVSISQAVRNNQGSLKLTMTPATGSGIQAGATLYSSTKKIYIANGETLRMKGFVPTTTPGTIKTRIWMVDSAGTAHQSDVITITKGQEFDLYFTPPTAAWTNYNRISVDFIAYDSDGSVPFVYYIDEIAQGNYTKPAKMWEEYSQAAVSGIRSVNESKLLMVEGYGWASSRYWPQNHPVKWINDSYNNTMYHAHMYLDQDASGEYARTYAQEQASAQGEGYSGVGARGVARAKAFTDWVAAQGTRGFIGEVGWPNADSVGTTEANSWNVAGEEVFSFLDAYNVGVTMWGTGTWLSANGNKLNVYQLDRPNIQPFVPLSPSVVLERHLGN